MNVEYGPDGLACRAIVWPLVRVAKPDQRDRHNTFGEMTCRECFAEMLIVNGWLICEKGCGRLVAAPWWAHKLWPDRRVEVRSRKEMVIGLIDRAP